MNDLTTESRLRLGWAEAAVYALEQCRPEQADALCAQWLEKSETGGPRHDPFGMVYSDARLWAIAAPLHELVAYTLAGLARIPKACLIPSMRRKVLKALWRSLTNTERQAFINQVTGGRT